MERNPRLSVCNREKMKQRNVTRFSNSMQETSYNYSDTNICYPLRKMKNNFKRRTLGSEHGAFSTEGEILTCKEFLLGLAA